MPRRRLKVESFLLEKVREIVIRLVIERKCLETRERECKLRLSELRNLMIHSQHSSGKYNSLLFIVFDKTVIIFLLR